MLTVMLVHLYEIPGQAKLIYSDKAKQWLTGPKRQQD